MIVKQLTSEYEILINAGYRERVFVTSILLTNITETNQEVYLHLVKNVNGELGTPSNDNLLLPPHELLKLEFYEISIRSSIELNQTNDAIFARCPNNNAVNTFTFEIIK